MFATTISAGPDAVAPTEPSYVQHREDTTRAAPPRAGAGARERFKTPETQGILQSGIRESNPSLELGKLAFYR